MARVSTTEGGYGGGASVIHTNSSHSEYVSVPDADLLFRGDYHRAGPDLVLSGHDGHHHIVPGYFASEKHAALVAPNGASLSADVVDLLAGSPAPGQYAQAQPTAPPNSIGKVEKVVGDVTVVRNGVSVALHVGDAVFKSDVIVTGGDSSAGITFPDGTVLDLVANSRMALNEYSFEPNGANNGAVFTLVEGTFGFVAGQVAQDNHMSVVTPVATMGIRGTAGIVRHEFRANAGDLMYSFLVLDEVDIRRHGHHVGSLRGQGQPAGFADFRRDPAVHRGFGICDFYRAAGLRPAADRPTEAITNSRLFDDRPILQDLVDSYGQFNGPGGIHSPGSGDTPNQLFGPQFLPENGIENPINFIDVTPTSGTNIKATTTTFTPPLPPKTVAAGDCGNGANTDARDRHGGGDLRRQRVGDQQYQRRDLHGDADRHTWRAVGEHVGYRRRRHDQQHRTTCLDHRGHAEPVERRPHHAHGHRRHARADTITVTATDSFGNSAQPQTIGVTGPGAGDCGDDAADDRGRPDGGDHAAPA